MIKTFAHKGLKDFFYSGSKKGIQAKQAERIGLILDRLQASAKLEDMNYPGSGFHGLKGNYKDFHSVKMSGNWRIIFKFENGHAYEVDCVDYD